MNDCIWCGTGNGICDDHMNQLFAQSAQIAAEGNHLASTVYGNQDTGQQDQQTESSQQAQTGTGGR